MTKDDLKFYLPYIGTLLVVFGATKLILYYHLFGLNICSYLDFSEILTLFLSDLIYFSFFILINTLWMFLMVPNEEFENDSKALHKTLTEQSLYKRLHVYAIGQVSILVLLILWVIGIPIFCIFLKLPFNQYMYGLYLLIGIFVFKTVIHETRRQWFIKFKEYPKMVYTNIATLGLLMLVSTISSSYIEHKEVTIDKKYFGTIVKLSDRSIVSDSNYYFIGKTRGYLFMHDEKKSFNDIIPMSEVKMLTEKTNQR